MAFQIGEQGGQITRALQHRSGGLTQVDIQLCSNDMGERCFAETGRTKQQYMIECIFALACCSYKNFQLLTQRGLTDIFVQALWAYCTINSLFVVCQIGGYETIR